MRSIILVILLFSIIGIVHSTSISLPSVSIRCTLNANEIPREVCLNSACSKKLLDSQYIEENGVGTYSGFSVNTDYRGLLSIRLGWDYGAYPNRNKTDKVVLETAASVAKQLCKEDFSSIENEYVKQADDRVNLKSGRIGNLVVEPSAVSTEKSQEKEYGKCIYSEVKNVGFWTILTEKYRDYCTESFTLTWDSVFRLFPFAILGISIPKLALFFISNPDPKIFVDFLLNILIFIAVWGSFYYLHKKNALWIAFKPNKTNVGSMIGVFILILILVVILFRIIVFELLNFPLYAYFIGSIFNYLKFADQEYKKRILN
ncbi:MAG: hypothetical protein ABIG96_05940 [Candidatus Micrarchaeota archaeon]